MEKTHFDLYTDFLLSSLGPVTTTRLSQFLDGAISERYPRWSLAGQLVRDAQAALDVLTALPYVEARQVYGLSYSLGSFVGLHLGAVDEHLAGAAQQVRA